MPKPLRTNLLIAYIGVDPGQEGGIASITGNTICLGAMPATRRDRWEVFETIALTCPGVAVLEKVHSMPKQGVASSFKFGQNYEAMAMALTAADIPFEEVTPQAWQKALGISPRKKTETQTQFKNRLKQFAQQLFPNENITLATCDALLIALYCKRKHEGVL